MKVLSLSDIVIPRIYSPMVRKLFSGVDLVFGCGDLPYYYLEYITSMLDVPTFFVRGNHAEAIEYDESCTRTYPHGTIDLHNKVMNSSGLLIAGVEGSIRYRRGPFQYSQSEMWMNVLSLVPQMLINRVLHGRYLDIFLSHASPWGVHDQHDLPHHGVKAFNWLLKIFEPAYHFHGHIHVYRPDIVTHTLYHKTMVINTFGHLVTDLVLVTKTTFTTIPRKQ